jgi:hypothetical protein
MQRTHDIDLTVWKGANEGDGDSEGKGGKLVMQANRTALKVEIVLSNT